MRLPSTPSIPITNISSRPFTYTPLPSTLRTLLTFHSTSLHIPPALSLGTKEIKNPIHLNHHHHYYPSLSPMLITNLPFLPPTFIRKSPYLPSRSPPPQKFHTPVHHDENIHLQLKYSGILLLSMNTPSMQFMRQKRSTTSKTPIMHSYLEIPTSVIPLQPSSLRLPFLSFIDPTFILQTPHFCILTSYCL